MDAQVKRQQELMRSLRVFIDALRDVKPDADVDASIKSAFAVFCEVSESVELQDELWKQRLVATFQSLRDCMMQIEAMDQANQQVFAPQMRCYRVFNPASSKSNANPRAPAGLLSLRDYSVLQAAMETFFCWCAHPSVEPGILLPIDRRRPTRTLGISQRVLQWGASRTQVVEINDHELLEFTRTMLDLLLLPQFQPIMLPKYIVELLALLVYGETCTDFSSETRIAFHELLESILRGLSLRLCMSNLRAVLGQATSKSAASKAFKLRCGQLLSKLLMEDGGVQTTMEMLLSSVDEGNTQARVQVAMLICQCPSGIKPADYAIAVCRQAIQLFELTNRSNKVLAETAVLLADQLAIRYTSAFEAEFVASVFRPLLLYEDSRENADLVASESEVGDCIETARMLFCGPPPSQQLLLALVPLVRPLIHAYAFAVRSKNLFRQSLEALLLAWIRQFKVGAALLLQLAVLPVTPPLTKELLESENGYERKQQARPLRELCAGGSGGIALRMTRSDDDKQRAMTEIIAPIVELLCAKELEESDVVGELFSSLLLTYMHVRKSRQGDGQHLSSITKPSKSTQEVSLLSLYEGAKLPTTSEGVEMILTFLLSIIESLGPSVLRSSATIMQCITTVLETYHTPQKNLVDVMEDSAPSGVAIEVLQPPAAQSEEDDGEDAEILTVCIGVVLTILEAGASRRPESDELQLNKMLPVLEALSQHVRPEIAELATDARTQILSRGAEEISATSTKKSREKSFTEVLIDVESDLRSPLVPLRARGMATLTKLVRKSRVQRGTSEWKERIAPLLAIYLSQLDDKESYVYLAAVQGLAALCDAHPDESIPLLVTALRDSTNSLETRIKLSEALLFTAKRCGETLPKYAKVLVYAYLDCIRPPPRASAAPSSRFMLIQEVNTNEPSLPQPSSQSAPDLVASTLRASCLSNLAEVCVLLQWGLHPFLQDVLTCAFGILQWELEAAPTQQPLQESSGTADKTQPSSIVAVRRGAVFLLKYLLQIMGWKVLEIMPDQLKPMYHTVKYVERTDRDQVVVFHAKKALEALNEIMRQELFPQQSDDSFGISSLRIVR